MSRSAGKSAGLAVGEKGPNGVFNVPIPKGAGPSLKIEPTHYQKARKLLDARAEGVKAAPGGGIRVHYYCKFHEGQDSDLVLMPAKE